MGNNDMSIFKALQLYAQFLREFPKRAIEENPSIKWIIGKDGTLIMILRLPKFDAYGNTVRSSITYQRTIDWFSKEGELFLVPPAYHKIVEKGAWWDFCIVRQDVSTEERHYVYV